MAVGTWASSQALEGAATSRDAGAPATQGQFRLPQRRRPAGRPLAMRLRLVLRQQFTQLRVATLPSPRCALPTVCRRPVVDAGLDAAQGLRYLVDQQTLATQPNRLIAPPVADAATLPLGSAQRPPLLSTQHQWQGFPPPTPALRPGKSTTSILH
jgi:hypothetical protein